MKTAVSIPDPVFRSAEELAARLGISRSELYSRALRDLIAHHDESTITEKLDRVYAEAADNPGLDPGLAALQARAVRGQPGRK